MNKKFFTFNSIHDDTFSSNLPYTAYTSFDTISPPLSQSSPYHDTDSLSDKSKKIRKKRNTYQKIDDETRRKLLDAVQQGDTLKAAAKKYGINYSSAKSILHTYRKEGRITKKSAQERTSRRRTKTSQGLEMSPIYPYKQSQDEFDGVHEASTYQTYHSPEKSDQTNVGFSEGGSPKAGVSGLPVNSFGGFLKIGYRHKSDNSNNRLSTPGIMEKLESQRSQTMPREDFGQSKSWQMNFNVQNPQDFYNDNCKEELRNQAKNQNAQKGCENYYINYASSPLPQIGQAKKQEQNVPKDYDNFAETYIGMEDSTSSVNYQAYDVSSFLSSSSPAYAFQQKMNGMNQHRSAENFSAVDQYRGVVEPQEMYYDGTKSAYMGDFRSKIEEGAAGYITRAGLSSY